jgi:hypothetical protein
VFSWLKKVRNLRLLHQENLGNFSGNSQQCKFEDLRLGKRIITRKSNHPTGTPHLPEKFALKKSTIFSAVHLLFLILMAYLFQR